MPITVKNTFGTPHHVSESNPAHVTGCDAYRLPLVGYLVPGVTPGYDDMVQMLKDNGHDTRPEGYGMVFLESEEFSATYFGSIQQIEQYQRDNIDGHAPFDASLGVMYARWPRGKGWDDFLPRRAFWNVGGRGAVADGVGLVTAFAHNEVPGAEVVVYEFEGRWTPDGQTGQLVTYHCTVCHQDTFYDSGHVHENTGPISRRWAARQARQHIIGADRHGVGDTNSPCRPNNGEVLRAVNAFARDMWGTSGNALPDTDDAYCATQGPCSIIRELRAGVRPAVYGR
ncbi:hypothetical protein ACFYX5_32370 [Streptomyces rubiginosohelvolus]|uniref:hypothetical protein n=1 Tax=Streptomyces rubiginosohelvolus TaxID=67362 RepID=UPI00369CD7FD